MVESRSPSAGRRRGSTFVFVSLFFSFPAHWGGEDEARGLQLDHAFSLLPKSVGIKTHRILSRLKEWKKIGLGDTCSPPRDPYFGGKEAPPFFALTWM